MRLAMSPRYRSVSAGHVLCCGPVRGGPGALLVGVSERFAAAAPSRQRWYTQALIGESSALLAQSNASCRPNASCRLESHCYANPDALFEYHNTRRSPPLSNSQRGPLEADGGDQPQHHHRLGVAAIERGVELAFVQLNTARQFMADRVDGDLSDRQLGLDRALEEVEREPHPDPAPVPHLVTPEAALGDALDGLRSEELDQIYLVRDLERAFNRHAV